MRIEERLLKRWIENFYGYGSWDAKIWFISHEESGGNVPEDVAERLTYFNSLATSGTATLCNMRELYQQVAARIDGPKATLFKTLYDYRFGPHAILHNGWKNLTAFSHSYKNKKLPDLLDYQRKNFTTGNGEALITLYPLPAPHNHAWYYSWLGMPQFDFLKSRTAYEEQLYRNRVHTILSNIHQYKPELVLMYGMHNILSLKKSVQDLFPGTTFKMEKAIKQQIPQYHRADLNTHTTLLITTQLPTLRHNRAETGFDWQEFAKTIK